MRKIIFTRSLIGIIFLFLMHSGYGQNDSVLLISLEEAKKYALEYNLTLKNAKLDIESAKKKIWETTAMGLPHAEATGSWTYNFTVPEFFEAFYLQDVLTDPEVIRDLMQNPADSARIIENALEERINQSKQSAVIDFTVTQLIFSGSYLVGLQTSKIYKNLSNYGYESIENDVIANVINSYFLVLITKENLEIMDSTYENTRQLYFDINAMFEQGLVEETDVDQLKLSMLTMQNSISTLNRQLEIVDRLLKFQIGLDFDKKVVLADTLQNLVETMNFTNILQEEYVVEQDPRYNLLKTQEQLKEQNVKLQKSAFLPTVSAYYRRHENLNKDAIDIQPPDVLGVNVSIPLFSSFERVSKVQQAKIELIKTQNSNSDAVRGLIMGFEEAKSSYISAMDKYEYTLENIALSKRIYEKTIIKYKNGLASSTELTQVQNQYLQNQSEYINTVNELIGAKLELEKALNKF
ncbi:MAG: TolC family protein [Bacteroidota bacterium]